MEDFIERILNHLGKIRTRYDELSQLVAAPEIIAHNKYWRMLVSQRADIEDAAAMYTRLNGIVCELVRCRADFESIADAEYKSLLADEIKTLQVQAFETARAAKSLLVSQAERQDGDSVLEIRAGKTAESAAFAFDLYNMYQNYTAGRGYSFGPGEVSRCAKNEIKSAAVVVSGGGAYQRLKHENGIHKAEGFLNAKSAAAVTVIVTPKPPETVLEIDDKDVRIDIFHSGGAGGQNVNKVESAVRITHLPTGITVTCQDERSQLKNKERALKTFYDRVCAYYDADRGKKYAEVRRQAAEAAASQRIRTYNYTQNSAIDYRCKVISVLDKTLAGELDIFIDQILLNERPELSIQG